MSGVAKNGTTASTNGTSTTDQQQAERVEENMKQLARQNIEWYSQVAERNRAIQQRREEDQQDR
jgi:hypothetical protein